MAHKGNQNGLRHGDCRKGGHAPEYDAYREMLARCTRATHSAFPHYGGRGITVCDAWLASYPSFLADVGRRPTPGHSIDRINNDGNYEPSNVRWVNRSQQSRNRRSNRIIVIDGVARTLVEWSIISGTRRTTITKRLRKGVSPRDAVFRPVAC